MNKVTQEELDWFVAGELDSDERDELFLRLDSEADGWKRCALALLEQRALQSSLGNLFSSGESPLPANGQPTTVPTPEKQPASPIRGREPEPIPEESRSWFGLALAASLLALLFGAGYWLGGTRSTEVVENAAFTPQPEINHAVVRRLLDQEPDVVLAVNAAVERLGVVDREVIALVSLTLNDHLLVLPVIESEMLTRQFSELPPPNVPADLSRKLARSGFAVHPHRQFLSVHHEDGTNEVLPMNMLDCRYIGKELF